MNRRAKFLQGKQKLCEVTSVGSGYYTVLSPSGETYIVHLGDEGRLRCNCEWSKYRPHEPCSHRLAVVRCRMEQTQNRRPSWWSSEEDARRQHRPVAASGAGLWSTTRLVA